MKTISIYVWQLAAVMALLRTRPGMMQEQQVRHTDSNTTPIISNGLRGTDMLFHGD